jgi:hypothetical protein
MLLQRKPIRLEKRPLAEAQIRTMKWPAAIEMAGEIAAETETAAVATAGTETRTVTETAIPTAIETVIETTMGMETTRTESM